MGRRYYLIAAALLLAGALGLARYAYAEWDPLNTFGCYKVSVTTTATSVRSLFATAAGATKPDKIRSLSISVPGSTVVCVGGSDVDCSTKYEPVCNAASCAIAYKTIPGDGGAVWLRSGGAVDAHICGGAP